MSNEARTLARFVRFTDTKQNSGARDKTSNQTPNQPTEQNSRRGAIVTKLSRKLPLKTKSPTTIKKVGIVILHPASLSSDFFLLHRLMGEGRRLSLRGRGEVGQHRRRERQSRSLVFSSPNRLSAAAPLESPINPHAPVSNMLLLYCYWFCSSCCCCCCCCCATRES